MVTVGDHSEFMHHVIAIKYPDRTAKGRYVVVLLVSDRKIGAWDRQRPRLTYLAKWNRLHALRIVWWERNDTIAVTPFDHRVPKTGERLVGAATVDVRSWHGFRLEARFRSRDVGQGWSFDVDVAAPVAIDSILEPEPDPE